jgi:toxin ParE1/3/4
MDYRLIISPEASEDLQALHGFIARDSPDNAARMVERILEAIEKLKLFPHRTVLERQNPKLKYPVRTLPVKPYVVYFRVIDEQGMIRVLKIHHGSRRRARKFE